MKAAILSYPELFAVAFQTSASSSVHPDTVRRINRFFDEVVPRIREGISDCQRKVRGTFNFSYDADIMDKIVKAMEDLGYRFSIWYFEDGGYFWEVELYNPKEA